MGYKLIIDGTLPNLNDYIKQLNISKFRGAELKRDTEKYISTFIRKQLRDVKITNKVFINFLWIEPNKKRDKDNIASAKKFIFDELVHSGVIPNDNWACVHGFADDFAIDSENPRVEMVILEVPDEDNRSKQ